MPRAGAKCSFHALRQTQRQIGTSCPHPAFTVCLFDVYRGKVQGSEHGRATGGSVEQEREKDKEEKPGCNFFKMQGEKPWKHFKLVQLLRCTPLKKRHCSSNSCTTQPPCLGRCRLPCNLLVVDGSTHTHTTYEVLSLWSSSSLTPTDLIRRQTFISVAAHLNFM